MASQSDRLEAIETIEDLIGIYQHQRELLLAEYQEKRNTEEGTQIANTIGGAEALVLRLSKARAILSEDMERAGRRRKRPAS